VPAVSAVIQCSAEDGGKPSSKGSKLMSKLKVQKKAEELPGVLGWAARKFRSVRHAAHGTFNRTLKVSQTCYEHFGTGKFPNQRIHSSCTSYAKHPCQQPFM
jgi:hypothetical protein